MFSSSKCMYFLCFALVSKVSGSQEENETKPVISEQMDPSIYMRQGMFQGFPSQQGFSSGQSSTGPSFGFTCKCTQKSLNPILTNPTGSLDANQLAQQQILQLQDQVRRQQEVINRQSLTKTGIENFSNLIALANSLDCSCSSDSTPSTITTPLTANSFPPNMASIYQPQGGYPGLTGGFVQRGVPVMTFGHTQPMIEIPYGA